MIAKIGAKSMKGMYATDHYNNGDLICELEGTELSVPDKYTIQIGDKQHLSVTEPYRFMNHHCSPSTKIEGRLLVAAKNTTPGQEITFDYNTTEDKLACPFTCGCCGKKIEGKLFVEESADIEQ